MATRCFLVLFTLGLLSPGCVELQLALQGSPGSSNNGSVPPGEDDGASGDDGSTDQPVVSLTVSNPNPLVNEEVILTCSIASGDTAAAAFDFQPDDGRLIVRQTTGTASFIVSESDVGTEFHFTCTGTNSVGTSDPSNEVVIIPTAQ